VPWHLTGVILWLKNFFPKHLCVLAKGAMIDNRGINGSVPEWLMGADCKSVGYAYAGSNPARPTTINARVAQW
jgi:hypothetical protein